MPVEREEEDARAGHDVGMTVELVEIEDARGVARDRSVDVRHGPARRVRELHATVEAARIDGEHAQARALVGREIELGARTDGVLERAMHEPLGGERRCDIQTVVSPHELLGADQVNSQRIPNATSPRVQA